ncbi:MAG: 1-acyl-sn-glycerol-3-phosphate acyltransferase [Oscillospiraceae bacterium]|nr:1-acyl-sn-glycerol-3-phosphate acyltransferase [Oscillospiraceae bacterium]
MKKPGIIYRGVIVLVRFFMKLWYNIKVEGRENVPKEGCVLASNHRTNADPPLLAICAGTYKYAFVAKEELFKNRFFGWLIRKLGAFPVSRGKGDMKVIDDAVSKVNDGDKLIIFPEGTRSKDGKVGKGKSGVAYIAAKAGAPVVPVGIVFEGKLKFRRKITVKFGKAISPDELKLSEERSSSELKAIKSRIMGDITALVEGE